MQKASNAKYSEVIKSRIRAFLNLKTAEMLVGNYGNCASTFDFGLGKFWT